MPGEQFILDSGSDPVLRMDFLRIHSSDQSKSCVIILNPLSYETGATPSIVIDEVGGAPHLTYDPRPNASGRSCSRVLQRIQPQCISRWRGLLGSGNEWLLAHYLRQGPRYWPQLGLPEQVHMPERKTLLRLGCWGASPAR